MKKWFGRLDVFYDYLQRVFLALIVLVVVWQVFSRFVLLSTPRWSSEIALVLLVWIGFMGIALGFRERTHIAIGYVVQKLPEAAQWWIELLIYAFTFIFGLLLLVEGASFVVETRFATLPGTGLPRSTLYLIIPTAGLMLCVYTVLQAFGVRTERHPESLEEELETPTKSEPS